MKKIVVAPDSFKGSLTSAEVADAVERGIKDVFPQCNVVKARRLFFGRKHALPPRIL